MSLLLTTALPIFLANRANASGEELRLHVPKVTKPPVIDGVLSKGEWDQAAALTGFRGAVYKTAFPESLRMVWYVGYDDKNLYLAMDARFPDKLNLKADIKEPDDDLTLYDDHVEIQVSSTGRQGAKTGGSGFYKLVINPRAAMHDTWYNNGTPGTEDLWSSGATVKSTNGKGFWRLEIAWPFQTMKVKHSDYQDLIVHISRAVQGRGWYFASLAPGSWDMWQEFYRFKLDPNAPSIQFLRKGDIVKGELDALTRVRGKDGETIKASLSIKNGDGKTIYSDSQAATIPAGTTHDFSFKASSLPITEESNSFRLEIKGKEGVLYNVLVPFREFTQKYVDAYMNPWIDSRPAPGEYRVDVAYLPSAEIVGTSVDLDVFGGLPKKFHNVSRYRARVENSTGKTIADKTFKIDGTQGKGKLEVGDLPEGKYICLLDLLDDAGNVVDSKKSEFIRKRYKWENNTLGMDKVVLPGFTPLKIDGETIHQCRNTLVMNDGGFPAKIKSDGHDILAKPIQVESTIGGKTSTWKTNGVTITPVPGRTFPADWTQYMWGKHCPIVNVDDLPKTDGYGAVITGGGEVGGVSVKVKNEMGYDGWQRIRLSYAPVGESVEIDNLDVVVTLDEQADIMRVSRTIADVKACQLPEKDGIIWQSDETAARPRHFLGTWVPCAYLGNGSRGIWYLAENDKGWSLADDRSCVFIERINGKPVLRLRLVNTPTLIDRERTVDFSLITTPAKNNPTNPRWRVWSAGCPNGEKRSPILWYNTGWRKYGCAGDGFYMPDDGFKTLGDWLANPEDFASVKNWATSWTTGQKKLYGDDVWKEKMPIVVYSSHSNFSPALPELATYGGEWVGKNNLVAGKDYKFSRQAINEKIRNFTGSYLWDTPAKAGEIQGMWTRSLMDCYMWYHHKLFKTCGINGTFYDNAGLVWWLNPDAGIGYIREDGHAQPQTNVYVRHELTRRLNTLCWLVGKPPMFYPNASTLDIPFAQKIIGIEGECYIWTLDGTIFDNNSVDGTRANLLSKGSEACIVAAKKSLHPHGSAGTSHRPLRSLFALCLALDIGCDRTAWDQDETRRLVKMLNEAIGLFDEKKQAEFIPYWDNKGLARFVTEVDDRYETIRPAHQFCSLYKNNGRVLVWLVNESAERVHLDLFLDAQKLLGHPVKSIRDLETGETVPHLKGDKKDNIYPSLFMPPKDFRAFILE